MNGVRRRMGFDMGGYLSSELVALIMLLITQFFYHYKNWIDVKKNRVYLELLHWGIAALFCDAIGNAFLLLLPSYKNIIGMISGMFMNVLMLGIFFLFYEYHMSYIRLKAKIVKAERVLVNVLAAAGVLFVLAIPVIRYSRLQKYHIALVNGRGNRILSAILILFLLMGGIHVFQHRKEISRRERIVMIFFDGVLLFDILMEIFLSTGNLVSYYLTSLVLVTYYMLLHNMDRYRFKSSGCFARVGFYTVLEEREAFQENFHCLGVVIKNVESITNYCTEDEIMEFHRRIGEFLQKNCGRHNVYQIHSFEYMVMYPYPEQVENKHKFLLEKIPDYIRINDKNVSLSVEFYAVEFADADYTIANFYSVITSMRKLSAKQANKEKLLHYHGNRQRDIEKNLEAMRVTNHAITYQEFLLQRHPIQSKKHPEEFLLELSVQVRLEDGEVISQEEVWRLAEKMGLQKELGKAVMEQVCSYIAKKELVTSAVKKIHINMSSSQLEDPELAKEYMATLKKYHIPGKYICIEVNLNQSSNYGVLEEVFGLFRGSGISLLLDQFGVSVFSLKTVINMPFDAVKINHKITRAYCEKKSNQLTYLLDMLNARHWNVVLDGVDEVVWEQMLSDLQYTYAQGMHIKRLYDQKQPGSPDEEEIGGAMVG